MITLLFDARFPVARLAMSVTYCNDYNLLFTYDVSDEIRKDRTVDATISALSFPPQHWIFGNSAHNMCYFVPQSLAKS